MLLLRSAVAAISGPISCADSAAATVAVVVTSAGAKGMHMRNPFKLEAWMMVLISVGVLLAGLVAAIITGLLRAK